MPDTGTLPPSGPPKKLQPLGSAPKCPHKRTDFRYELWMKERKLLRAKARKNSFRIENDVTQPRQGAVTVDTSKARSTVDVLRLCLKELGWREFPYGKRDGGHCDIYWHSIHFSDQPDVTAGKVSKFPGMVETVRKVNLGRTLDILRGLFPDEYDFHPESWFLPQQYAEFSDAVRRAHHRKHRPVYIVKPDEGSQGEGIYLIHDPKEYMFANNKYHVVQEYLAEPLLLENLKFDFRVYVVMTSLEPLEVYIYKEGLARFCTVSYQYPSNKNIHDAYMHLTNYSLNKRSATYLHTESGEDGSKRTMRSVFRKLSSMGFDTQRLWEDIKRLVVKTTLAMAPLLKVEYRAEIPPGKPGPSCFQILGFDVIIMDDLKPMLLEVNANPSLRLDFEHEVAPGIVEHIHSPVDEEVKRPLVLDTCLLVAPRQKTGARWRRSSSRDSSGKENDSGRSGSDGHTDDSDGDYEPKVPRGYSSLEQVYPARFADDYEHLRILERTVEVFLYCLGVRGQLRMGPTGFRTFTRKCKLTASLTGLTNAALDIMFIDLQRRWEYMNPDNRTSGLCYQGFLEAFFMISKKKFPAETALESVQTLLDYCECNLDFTEDHKPQPGYLPRITKADKKLDDLKSVYGASNRKTRGSSFFLDYKSFSVEKTKTNKQGTRCRTKSVKEE